MKFSVPTEGVYEETFSFVGINGKKIEGRRTVTVMLDEKGEPTGYATGIKSREEWISDLISRVTSQQT